MTILRLKFFVPHAYKMKVLIKYIVLLLFLFLANFQLYAKVLSINSDISLKFEKLSVEHGLSQSNVNAILQDSKGFLWFGTDDGLNKYDGYSFAIYKSDPNDSSTLSSDFITSLYEDSTGTIWVGTYGGGLNKYDSRLNKFIRYQFDENDPISLGCNYVNTIYEDKEHIIWIGTASGGLHKYNSKTDGFIKFKSDSSGNGLRTNFIGSLFEDTFGVFWVGTNHGLYIMDKNDESFVRVLRDEQHPDDEMYNNVKTIYEDDYGTIWIGFGVQGLNRYERKEKTFSGFLIDKDDPNSFTYNDIVEIIEDRSGNLWIATDGGGLYIFNRDMETFLGYQNIPNDPTSISNNYLRSIYEDRNGILWVGTWGSGVNKVVRKKQHFGLYQNDPNNRNSLSHNRILRLLADKDGYIWIGTDGGGLDRFDSETESFRHFKYSRNNSSSLSNNYISALYEDSFGNIWVGTWGGGLNRFNKNTGEFKRFGYDDYNMYQTSHSIISTIEQDNDGNLYIGTQGGGLNIISSRQINSDSPIFEKIYADTTNPFSLPSNYINRILKDAEGDIWLATPKTGLVLYDVKRRLFTTYINNPDDSTSIHSNNITCIYEPENNKDIIWIGTRKGLNKLVKGYKDNPPVFIPYTTENGLPSNGIYSIIEDDDENLWISTDRGISKFNPYDESFYNFDVRDGLQSNLFTLNAICKSAEGEIYLGGVNGLNVFAPTKIKTVEGIPPVVLTDLKLFNESVHPGEQSPIKVHINEADKIIFDYYEDAFSIEFASLDLSEPIRNQYAYKLEGFNDEWIYTNWDKRFASYTSLPAGEYIFRVKASNSDGVWNEEGISILIEIVPPFWQRWWFLLLSVSIVGVIIFVGVKRRFHGVRMKIELQAAHDAQMSIMPQEDPKLPYIDVSGLCVPASEVGGDFFDYIWLNKEQTKFGIAVGDVSGKAMRSAMTAVLTSGMISSQVQDTSSIDTIMTKINFPIYQKTDRQMFIALCLASIDLNECTMNFTNAGLMQPIYKSNGTLNILESAGPKFPLGAFSNTVYEKRSLKLHPGDVIVIYSDGITEAQNSVKEFYGLERMTNFINKLDPARLTSKQIKNLIINDIQKFTGNSAQHDDMTLVVVKIDDKKTLDKKPDSFN